MRDSFAFFFSERGATTPGDGRSGYGLDVGDRVKGVGKTLKPSVGSPANEKPPAEVFRDGPPNISGGSSYEVFLRSTASMVAAFERVDNEPAFLPMTGDARTGRSGRITTASGNRKLESVGAQLSPSPPSVKRGLRKKPAC